MSCKYISIYFSGNTFSKLPKEKLYKMGTKHCYANIIVLLFKMLPYFDIANNEAEWGFILVCLCIRVYILILV